MDLEILGVHNLSKSFGTIELFKNVSFDIYKTDRIGLIGANGSGKSTLFKCILNKIEVDSGYISMDKGDKIGYMKQEASFKFNNLYDELKIEFKDILDLKEKLSTLEEEISHEKDEIKLEELMEKYGKLTQRFEYLDGYDFEAHLKKIAFGLGFSYEDFKKDPNLFSGGQKTRVSLAKTLIRQPDFLFLDEPTNHLDIEMIEWLEEYLKNYKGGLVIISHDRFFLDRICNKILDLENKTTTLYDGNYKKAMEVKAQRNEALKSAYEKQQEYINKTMEYIRKYKAGIKSKQARGREKQLNRLDRIILPPNKAMFNYFMFKTPEESAQRVLEIEDLSFNYPNQDIFQNLNLLIRKGDGCGIVGKNGSGKTTLLKIISREIEDYTGKVHLGNRVQFAYYSQEHENLDPQNTIFDEIANNFFLNDEQIRSCLGAFLFTGDDIYKKVKDLSGGEKSRLALLKLMMEGANFLLLDEPTNHLDIPAKEALENAIMAYPGTFLVVSHDRYFLDKVTNITLELDRGIFTEYGGNFSYYREKKLEMELEKIKENPPDEIKAIAQKEKSPKEIEKNKNVKSKYAGYSKEKLESEILKTEALIQMYEMELKGLEHLMNDVNIQNNPQKSSEIAKEYEDKSKIIQDTYAIWEEMSKEMEGK